MPPIKIDGGPSVLFDAVAILPSEAGAALLVHSRISLKLDEGFVSLAKPKDAARFVATCRKLRHWPRELEVDLDVKAAPANETVRQPSPRTRN